MKVKSKCPYCGNEFQKTHGNQVYCSIACKNSQAKLYDILKDFRKGFLNNYKLLSYLLPKAGIKTVLLADLEKKGFQHNCYYGAYTDSDKNHWYKVHNYTFTLVNKNHVLSITIKNT